MLLGITGFNFWELTKREAWTQRVEEEKITSSTKFKLEFNNQSCEIKMDIQFIVLSINLTPCNSTTSLFSEQIHHLEYWITKRRASRDINQIMNLNNSGWYEFRWMDVNMQQLYDLSADYGKF